MTQDKDFYQTDVLVIGGGPAGIWAALSAMEAGASVILAEKGYVGTSGPTAAGNSSIIDTAPASAARARAVKQRVDRGLGLVDPELVEKVFDEVHHRLNCMADWGYDFPRNDDGQVWRGSMRGVDYLRFLRQRLIKGKARILDQSPALGLLTAGDTVAGAHGINRQTGRPWQVSAGAVVIATGGCAFKSGALGTNGVTGDGCLFASEVGASFSGMEFTGQYGIAPKGSSVTKGVIYFWASFRNEHGQTLTSGGDRQDVVARGLMAGERVFATLDRADPRVQSGMRGQANVFLPFDRQGIDPFTKGYEVELLYEGTIRGTGGIYQPKAGATEAQGLYAAGDAASREPIAGATSGGGGPNASWALASGVWAGRDAAAFAKSLGANAHQRALTAANTQITQPAPAQLDLSAVVKRLQDLILPLDQSFLRTEASLLAASHEIEILWRSLRGVHFSDIPSTLRHREALGMIATARLILASALKRGAGLGIHRRKDLASEVWADWNVRSGGLDQVWAHPGGKGGKPDPEFTQFHEYTDERREQHDRNPKCYALHRL